MLALQAFNYLLKQPIGRVIDVGSGTGEHARKLRQQGFEVVEVNRNEATGRVRMFEATNYTDFDYVWASHVLEHSRNPGIFLERAYHSLVPGGTLLVTVPPAKIPLVGGHLTLWTPGLLCYNAILAGFDCRDAYIWTYDYNISLIVKRPETRIKLPELNYDIGDLELLSEFFPSGFAKQNMHTPMIRKPENV